jgi:hypothetical protein
MPYPPRLKSHPSVNRDSAQTPRMLRHGGGFRHRHFGGKTCGSMYSRMLIAWGVAGGFAPIVVLISAILPPTTRPTRTPAELKKVDRAAA